jgi:cation diffusion facilitator family transporter
MNSKIKAAIVSIVSNTVLILSKLIVGVLTNSVSIISEAVHSFTDLLASVIAFLSVQKSSMPADSQHPYGHGKFEEVSGLVEGGLILFAAIFIIHESIGKIASGEHDFIDSYAGIAVMAVSGVVNFLISQYLFKVAKNTDSIAIKADAEHLRTDYFTSFGVLAGLIIIKLTGNKVLDPIIAILVAIFILKAGFEICLSSAKNLLDTSLPSEDTDYIKNVLLTYSNFELVEFKDLKTRKSGSQRILEFTLIVPKSVSVEKSHDLCDRIEQEIEKKIKNPSITIHVEPCDYECKKCHLNNKNCF